MKTKNLFLIAILFSFFAKNNSFAQTTHPHSVTLGNVLAENSGWSVHVGINAGPNADFTNIIPYDHGMNCFIGHSAGLYSTTGHRNVFLGYQSGLENTTGHSNTYVGVGAGRYNQIGNSNTNIGLNSVMIGDENTLLGYATGGFNYGSGSRNLFLGYESGNASNGNDNVFIGYRAGKGLNVNDKLIIAGKNSALELIKGDFVSRHLLFNVNTNTPGLNSFVEINGNNWSSGLRFSNLTSSFTPTESASKFLTVDGNGDVILRNLPSENNNPLSCNLYTCDGIIDDNSTFDNLRYVDMNHNNIHFGTSFSEYGKIYIGQSAHPSFEFLDTMNQTNLENYKLFVEGGIITERVKVALRNSTDWADYVFADNYKLMPLNELETFVKENKHLPGVKSAEELSKSGIDVVDMQSKQMEKIEELTLYAIEQSKEIEKQAKELEELKAQVKALLERK